VASLEYGLLEHGFLRVKCDGYRHEHLVTFSCKRRGFRLKRLLLVSQLRGAPHGGVSRPPGTPVPLHHPATHRHPMAVGRWPRACRVPLQATVPGRIDPRRAGATGLLVIAIKLTEIFQDMTQQVCKFPC